VLSQKFTFGVIRILCLDDGTSPRASSILQNMPVRVVELRPGASISHAKNVALRLAVDEFVFFLDDHITLQPGGIEAAMVAFRADPELAGVCGFYRSARTSDWNTLRDIKRHSIYGKSTHARQITLDHFTTFSTGIGIVRRSVFLRLGFPEADFPADFGGEDAPALLEALNGGLRFAYEPRLSGYHEHDLSLAQFLRKVEIEVRGRYSVFYWASGRPELRVPYLHGFLNCPLFLYFSLCLAPATLAWSGWTLLVPSALLALEAARSLRCLMTPVPYRLRHRCLAALYVLTSDLLTPLCGIQYLVSSYKRPYDRLGFRRAATMLKMFLGWELIKIGLAGNQGRAGEAGAHPVRRSSPADVEAPTDAA
jgi:glycosyltransferase involved in cell wall biosynthesis